MFLNHSGTSENSKCHLEIGKIPDHSQVGEISDLFLSLWQKYGCANFPAVVSSQGHTTLSLLWKSKGISLYSACTISFLGFPLLHLNFPPMFWSYKHRFAFVEKKMLLLTQSETVNEKINIKIESQKVWLKRISGRHLVQTPAQTIKANVYLACI